MTNVLQNFKKNIALYFLLLLSIFGISAKPIQPNCIKNLYFLEDCDLCSCSTGSGSFGFGTLSNSNFIGLRYIYQSFESRNGIFSNSPLSQESFNTVQLWAQIPIYKTFFISTNIPYQNLTREFQGTKENLNGIGDTSIIGWYKLMIMKKSEQTTDFYNNQKEPSGHSFQFGLGAKLPTGEFEERLADSVNPGFQVGTGSVDGIFALGYNYGGNTFGVNTLLTYYLKGENKNEYQFGNQISYTANAYFPLVNNENMSIMPFLGVSGDFYELIKQYGETIADTDGKITNLSFGSEFSFKKIIFGTNFSFPIAQDLFGGNVETQHRLLTYLNFAF